MLNYDILVIKEDDVFELPQTVCNTIQEASEFIGCKQRILYKNKALYGVMKANGFVLEFVRKEDIQ